MKLASFFISQINIYLCFYFAFSIFFQSKRKEKEAILSSITFLFASIFFIGHSFAVQKNFVPVLNLFSTIILPSILLIHFLPLSWMLLVFFFFKEKKYFSKISNQKIYSFISFLLNAMSLISIIQHFNKNQFLSNLDSIPQNNLILFQISILCSPIFSIIYILETKLEKDSLSSLAKNKSFYRILICSVLLLFLALVVSFGISFYKIDLILEVEKLDSLIPKKLFLFDFISIFLIFLILIIIGKGIMNYQIFTGSIVLLKSAGENYNLILKLIFIISSIQTLGIYFKNYLDYKEIFLSLTFFIFIFYYKEFQKKLDSKHKKILNPFFFRENLRKILFEENISLNLNESFFDLAENYLETEKSILILIHPIKLENEIFTYPEKYLEIDFNLIQFVKSQNEDLIYLKESVSKDFFICIKLGNPSSSEKGFLFLGAKKNHQLYTEEELEIAKFGLKNLIELFELILLSKTLIGLKKDQINENRLFDHLSRRILHDEILPEIQAILIEEDSKKNNSELIHKLTLIHKNISKLLKQIPDSKSELKSENFLFEIQNLIQRENPSAKIHFENILNSNFDFLSSQELEILYYAFKEFVRNISRYAKKENEVLEINFQISEDENKIYFILKDNGVGISKPQDPKGSGSGILIHKALLNSIGADLEIDSKLNEYTIFKIIILKNK